MGKTHLGIALGVAATEAGYRTYFTTAADMVHALQAAHLEGSAQYKLRTLPGPLRAGRSTSWATCPLDQASANWIFQVVSRRYDKGSIILTGNRGFGDWGQVFADPVVAAAIVDRLLHHAAVLNIRGRSYRLRAYQDDPAPAAAPGRKGGAATVP